LLKFESNLVCVPCRHVTMIVAFHSLVNTVMTEHPRQLLHMDTVDPSRVHFMGGKWYILVIIHDYSHYSWVSSWKVRMKCLSISKLGFEVEQ
jgi:hypothetical protein